MDSLKSHQHLANQPNKQNKQHAALRINTKYHSKVVKAKQRQPSHTHTQ